MRDQEIPFQQDVQEVLGGHKDYNVVEQNFKYMKEVLKKFETKDGVDYSHLTDEAMKIWAKAFSVQLLKEQIGPEHMTQDVAVEMVLERQKVQLQAMQGILWLIESENSKFPEIAKDDLRKTRSKSVSAPTPTPSSEVIPKPRSHSESEIGAFSTPLLPPPAFLSEMSIAKTTDAYAKWVLDGVAQKALSLRIERVKIQFPDKKDQEAICLKVCDGMGMKGCQDFEILQKRISEIESHAELAKPRAMSLPNMSRASVDIGEEVGKTRERSTSLPESLSEVLKIGKKVGKSTKVFLAKVASVVNELPQLPKGKGARRGLNK